MIHRQMSMSFAAWRDGALHEVRRAEETQHVSRALFYLTNRLLVRGWESWLESRQTQSKLVQKIARAAARMSNRQLSCAFTSWAQVALALTTTFSKMKVAAHVVQSSASRRGYNAWVEMTELQSMFHERLRLGVSFMVNRGLAFGFAGWRAGAKRETLRVQEMLHMSRAALYILNRMLSRAWGSWRDQQQTRKRKLDAVERSVAHIRNRHLSKALASWSEAAVDHAEVERALRFGGSFFINHKLALGFAG